MEKARKSENKVRRAARRLKKTVGKAISSLRGIKRSDASIYATELVEKAKDLLLDMAESLKNRDFRTAIEASPELQAAGVKIKDKIMIGKLKAGEEEAERSGTCRRGG